MESETTYDRPQDVDPEENPGPGLRTTVTYQSITPTVSDRFKPIQFHARGGIGEVWLAEDAEIGRQVALKRLLRSDADSGTNERFMAEAQIAGQLEHPGIVPVHDLGIDKSGKPYYVMKFVHGRTLRDGIEEYHALDSRDVSERALQQQRLLDHFVDICEAVAFAHTRGVVHRDLKPSNVMLGLFGETIVLDWGLAKVLHQPEIPGLSTAVTSSGRSSETAQGSVLGTPAYMSPELAAGKSADAGPPTDIYLLGATLYEILCGNAPRRGSSRDEIVEMARTVSPKTPREVNKQVARALDAICLKAMAKREIDRYGSALELAEDVRRFLAGEPVSTYREPLPARVWRWTKRHRRGLARVATAALIVGVITGAWAAVGNYRQRAAQAELIAAERTAAAERLESIDIAQQQLAMFRGLYDEALFHIGYENADEQFTYFDVGTGRQLVNDAVAIAGQWGSQLESLPLDQQRESLKQELYELLVLRARTAAMMTSVQADLALDDLAQAASFRDPSRGFYELRADLLRARGDPEAARQDDLLAEAAPVDAFDHFLRAEKFRTVSLEKSSRSRDLESAVEEYRSALMKDADHYWSRLQLGRCYLARGQFGEAIEALGGCEALRPEAPWASTARGIALARDGRFAEALSELNRVIDWKPDFLPARLNRGWVHWRQKDFANATADFNAVLAHPQAQSLILAEFYLGQMNLQQGNLQVALTHFKNFAGGPQQDSFWIAHRELAKVHYLLGQDQQGLVHLNRYLKLTSADPFDPATAQSQFRRGKFLRGLLANELRNATAIATNARNAARLAQLKQVGRAILKIALEELVAAEKSLKTPDLYYELGLVFTYHKTKPTFLKAVEAYTDGLRIEPDTLKLLNGRGSVYWVLGQSKRALADYTQAGGLEPKFPRDQVLLAEAHGWVGVLHTLSGDSNQAIQHAARSVTYLLNVPPNDPDLFMVLHNVACVYGGVSELDEGGRAKLQDMAIEALELSLEKAQLVGSRAQEIKQINQEGPPFFGPELKARPEFQRLLQGQKPQPPNA